jgi:hypothetical protein
MRAQAMLGYTDIQGDYYVNDSGRIVHLEHLRIRSSQPAANSIAYLSNAGNLMYYANHEQIKLEISNPTFYKNTDHYLYYSTGGSFSVFNGKERKYLGYIQQHPYAFGDSIAAVHDYSGYFYTYVNDLFIELENQPVLKVIAGDNILAYVNHIGQFKAYYLGNKVDLDDYSPIAVQASANIIGYIDNYQYLRVYYQGSIHELCNFSTINCLSSTTSDDPLIASWCNGPVVTDVQSELPVFQVGDDMVAYIDDMGRFNVFYKGNIVALESQPPKKYAIVDKVLYYTDENDYLKVFCNGEMSIVETYTPTRLIADGEVLAYLDLDKRLKAFYLNTAIDVSENIVLDFSLNNTAIMYNEIPNKYKFYSLE